MDKIAQKRRLRTKLREMINAPTEALIGKFSPQFIELMDQLREIDDSIRVHASELKNMLKLAKTNFNRREYMTAIAYVGQFHEKVDTINNELAKLATSVNVKHHEFLFGDMDPEHIEYLLKKLSPKLTKMPSIRSRASIEKSAGITDWWYNLTTDRGRALKAWEARFPKESKELKRQTESMIKKSEGLLDNLLSTLKSLSSLRATRRLEEYLQTAEKFKQKFRVYDSTFSAFYNLYVKKFVEIQKELMDKQEVPGAVGTLPLPTIQMPGPKPMTMPMPEAKVAPKQSPWSEEHPFDPHRDPWPESHPEENVKTTPESSKHQAVKHRLWDTMDKYKLYLAEEARKKQQAAPDTEYDVGSTIRSPHPDTIKEEPIELSQIPNIEESTMVSPKLEVQHKDKPIDVSVVSPKTLKSHQKFLDRLNKTADNAFVIAAELITYANSIKHDDPEVSQQLLQLSNKMLIEDS